MLIVLYQKRCEDSIALQSLLKQQQMLEGQGVRLELVIWNNSPGTAVPWPGVRWHEAENEGLSKIYNQVAKQSFDLGMDLFMISDDDTDYSNIRLSHCLEQVEHVLSLPDAGGVGVFLPKLKSHGQLVSPGKRWLFMGRLEESVNSGFVASRNLLAINSGLIFTRNCFERMKPFYDERLRFYGTDTDFFVRYEKYYESAYVLDVLIDHDLSEHSSGSVSRAVFRFDEMVRGLNISFSSHGMLVRLLLSLYLAVACLRKAWSYKSLDFIKVFLVYMGKGK